ncbi:gamma-glutamyl-gamma-aminobutyrate hydrolase family protein [Oceanibacterium hippocampi]|uniref:gamma-glutamyl-gamma-aminobutyrate hydrolase n=1 Tax=Oceanibacterium hippocampi TaxID=745714 RepID=A0A1Y5RJJ9_9PROT|nr:gamma-glutamyl-gamma-aminobutyrate hydrolase family protein [Oceanibacterium hippocampi]SLN16363.1 Gamma-glutamyl-gamma-aminobutyrate hydrolase PuuD [Oceanibacterium hippocampi]
MSAERDRLLIGVTACVRDLDRRDFHVLSSFYVDAVAHAMEAVPLVIPALGPAVDWTTMLDRLDGLLFTGSPSNIEPHHYAGPPARDGVMKDARRDATTLPLIRETIRAGVPMLAICRGLQELNVAYGGSLHQHVEEVPGRTDHRSRDSDPMEVRYALRHEIAFTPGGQLAAIAGTDHARVNSLHGQGIDRLGTGLEVEATAPDGTIEAVRVADAQAFALAVQWHPEWKATEIPLSRAIFAAFGDACRQHAERRNDRPAQAGGYGRNRIVA